MVLVVVVVTVIFLTKNSIKNFKLSKKKMIFEVYKLLFTVNKYKLMYK